MFLISYLYFASQSGKWAVFGALTICKYFNKTFSNTRSKYLGLSYFSKWSDRDFPNFPFKGSTLSLDLKLLVDFIQRRLTLRRIFIDMINQDFVLFLWICSIKLQYILIKLATNSIFKLLLALQSWLHRLWLPPT